MHFTCSMSGSTKKSFYVAFSLKSWLFLNIRSEELEPRCMCFLSTKVPVMATLGISTNTRLLGLAIIHKDSLIDYSIHLHKSPWSPAKVTEIITSLEACARRYCIKNVVLSIPYAYHQTKAWKFLNASITKFFKTKGIPVRQETPETLYSFCSSEQKKTKKAMMHSLTLKYPELNYCYYKELRNRGKYYIKVFEAIAVATIHEQMK